MNCTLNDDDDDDDDDDEGGKFCNAHSTAIRKTSGGGGFVCPLPSCLVTLCVSGQARK